jgi:hypothetical protein
MEKYSKKTGPYIACWKKECGYKEAPISDTPDQSAGEPPKDPATGDK